MKSYRNDPNYLFTLHVPTTDGKVIIRAFEGKPGRGYSPTHHHIDVEVRLNGREVFKRGQLYCGIPQHYTMDGNVAKEQVMALVGMKPGDTDSEYFEDYSQEQIDFAYSVGEEFSMVRQDRYCDQNGNVKE